MPVLIVNHLDWSSAANQQILTDTAADRKVFRSLYKKTPPRRNYKHNAHYNNSQESRFIRLVCRSFEIQRSVKIYEGNYRFIF